MKRPNQTRGIRFGELLGPLDRRAKALGISRTDLVLGILRKALGETEVDAVGVQTHAEHGLSRACIRWGDTLELLDARAAQERLSSSAVARKAVRLYVANGELPKVEAFRAELEQFRREVAKIGGNLNQVAVHMNDQGTLKTTELGRAHDDMRTLFKEMVSYYKRMVESFDKRIP